MKCVLPPRVYFLFFLSLILQKQLKDARDRVDALLAKAPKRPPHTADELNQKLAVSRPSRFSGLRFVVLLGLYCARMFTCTSNCMRDVLLSVLLGLSSRRRKHTMAL